MVSIVEHVVEMNERNARVQRRYDEMMQAGRHGHYETMFRVVKEEVERERMRWTKRPTVVK